MESLPLLSASLYLMRSILSYIGDALFVVPEQIKQQLESVLVKHRLAEVSYRLIADLSFLFKLAACLGILFCLFIIVLGQADAQRKFLSQQFHILSSLSFFIMTSGFTFQTAKPPCAL